MTTLCYNIFLVLYGLAFRIAALFNNKARLGVAGRKNVIAKIVAERGTKQQQLIWMHCASLGEFEQGRPVLEALKLQYPGCGTALSFFSASGYEVMKNYAGADHIFYLPLDSPSNAKKLVGALSPSLVVWIKYEFWYHYLHALKERQVPVLLVSGIFRQTHPFFKWYGGLWKRMLRCFTWFFVQNESSMRLLATVGIHHNVIVSGDTRFDRVIRIAEQWTPVPAIAQFCGDSKILVAGSTWDEDEAELIHYVKANPQMKFIIVPHETDAENLKDVKKEFVNSVFYSALLQTPAGKAQPTDNVLIIDNVGMLSRLYRYADVTYVGGAFGGDGVHNVLEAAVYGRPVIFGPHHEKFPEAVALVNLGGGIAVSSALELENALNELWQHPALLSEKGESARAYVYANAGATAKIIRVVQEKRLLTS